MCLAHQTVGIRRLHVQQYFFSVVLVMAATDLLNVAV